MLGYDREKLETCSALFTASEIAQQPETWLKTSALVQEKKQEVRDFIDKVVSQEDFDIIFTGAGTSEFVGNTLYSCLNRKYNYRLKSYATTDIVAAPQLYVAANKATLLISFGRSGSSPESIGTIEAVNAVACQVYHLFITCNPQGAMAQSSANYENCLALVLAPETCDQGFAMTSSFSNMLLCAYLCLTIDEDASGALAAVATAVRELIENGHREIHKVINDFAFQRIVYLGANMFKGIAQESALKMLELTAGGVVTMFDTPLGFRHGPKSIIDETTLIVVYLSEDAFTQKYDIDLITEIAAQRQGNKILLLSNKRQPQLDEFVDYHYSFDLPLTINNALMALNYVVFAQMMALFKALALGITPDNPCPGGAVNRVVKGVVIYPYEK